VDAFTLFHVVLSLVGILSGFMVLFGFLVGKQMNGSTAIFLITTVATSVTGFLFPFHKLLPSHILGILSLIVLTIAIVARYKFGLTGGWRRTYVISAALALYFNFFVLIVQSFQKVPALKDLAPTQTEPPFVAAQVVALVLFVVLTILAAIRFKPATAHAS
jgi:hypothetical protein